MDRRVDRKERCGSNKPSGCPCEIMGHPEGILREGSGWSESFSVAFLTSLLLSLPLHTFETHALSSLVSYNSSLFVLEAGLKKRQRTDRCTVRDEKTDRGVLTDGGFPLFFSTVERTWSS